MPVEYTIAPCKYKLGRLIGEGAYAVVRNCIDTETKERYAVKIFNRNCLESDDEIINEIEVLQSVSHQHKNILSLVDSFQTIKNFYLVTDLATGGDLLDKVIHYGSFSEDDTITIIQTILNAVTFLHEHNIVHRDLKPENILFKSDQDNFSDLLIADFGLSKILKKDSNESLKTLCGTPDYMAPEVFQGQRYGKPIDMWAIGIITYILLCGTQPFEGIQETMYRPLEFQPDEEWDNISNLAKDFISKLLVKNPKSRLTCRQASKHPWLNRQLVNANYRKNHSEMLNVISKFQNLRKFKKVVRRIMLINDLKINSKPFSEKNLSHVMVPSPRP